MLCLETISALFKRFDEFHRLFKECKHAIDFSNMELTVYLGFLDTNDMLVLFWRSNKNL